MKNLKKEKACGCIVIDNGKVLLVQQNQGFWGLPKGHVENGESEIETAIREVKEETNIDVFPYEDKRYVQEYIVKDEILKEVVYFVASKGSSEIIAQEAEIKNIEWLGFKEAISRITFNNTKELLQKALKDCGYKI